MSIQDLLTPWTFWTFWCKGGRGFINRGLTLESLEGIKLQMLESVRDPKSKHKMFLQLSTKFYPKRKDKVALFYVKHENKDPQSIRITGYYEFSSVT